VHVILRGGANGPNYKAEVVKDLASKLHQARCNESIIVDCSHGNSGKDFRNQKVACADVCSQISSGEKNIVGVMIESNLIEGSQSVTLMGSKVDDAQEQETSWHTSQNRAVLDSLKYGVSITDSCVGWEETVKLLDDLASAVRRRRSELSK